MTSKAKPMVSDYERTALAIEGVKQAKFKRWAVEMREHGWDVREPTPKKVKALALHFAQKRLEAAQGE